MGKSSSSLKRNRDKKSSSKGHNKSKSWRKSRKYKSNKIRRRDDSFPSSNEDYSVSSISVSSSSTDHSYRKRKVLSRAIKYVKGRKKRARRHSYSTESSEDSTRNRKRKRSKRKDADFDVRKKTNKKKPRKVASVSSTRSESRSCSTCQSGSESRDSEYENHRSRLDRRENDGRNSEGGKNETNRYSSRSCSSCSCYGSHDLYNGDKYKVEKKARRLKSVITIPHDVEVDGKLPLDEMQNKEQDHECFRSSNGSFFGSSKRESVCSMEIEYQTEAQAEIEKRDANADVGCIFTDGKKDDRMNHENTVVEDQYVRKETSEVSGTVGSFKSEDLEAVLRERALENLRNFRQELNGKASNLKNKMNSVAKQNRVEKEERSKTMPTVGNGKVIGTKSAKESFVKRQPSALSVSRDDLSFSRNTERIGDQDLGSHNSDPARHELAEVDDHTNPKLGQDINRPAPSPQASKVRPLLKREIVSQGSKDIVAYVNNSSSLVPKLSSSIVSLSHNVEDEFPYKDKGSLQETLTQEVSHIKQLENDFGLAVNASSEQTIAQDISNVGKDLGGDSSTLRSSSCKPSSKECSSNKLHDEANGTSQFEQKTMQVMRGGEMVQVRYRVYIPKKAPALSRRQLKR